MVFILLIAISFFAKSDVILGHSTPSSTLLTSTFFPTYPVFSCTGSLSQNRDQSLSLQSQSDAKYERPLFTFGSQSDASLNSTLERLKVLSEYSKAGSDFGEFAQIKSFDFDQVSEIVRLVFGVDISNLEVAERDDQSRDDESMDDLSKYSTAGGKIGELADIKSFDHDQTFEVANRQFGMNITKSENAKIKKVVDFYEFFSIAEVAFCAIGDMIHIIGGFYKNPGCIVCDCLDNLSILRKCEVIGVLSQSKLSLLNSSIVLHETECSL